MAEANVSVTKSERKNHGAVLRTLWVIGVVFCVVFGFTLICNLVIIVKGAVNPDMPPSVLGTTPMVVKSGSMHGTIEVGDLVLVGKAKPSSLEVGDVIAFMQGRVVITHRIVGIETGSDGKRLFRTKGDFNNTQDEQPVPEKDIVGIYRWRIPKMGDFALFLQTPLGMVLFIGVPLLLFIVPEVIRNRRSAKSGRKKAAELEEEIARLRKAAGSQGGEEAEEQDDTRSGAENGTQSDAEDT